MTENSSGGRWRIPLLVGRLALAAIFLFAAYAKLKPQTDVPWSIASIRTSLSMFAMQVDSFQLLPETAVNAVAHLLPPFELLLGIWLLSGIALRYSALVTTILLGGFFAVVVRSYMAGLEINCGCFGPGQKLGPWKIVEDGLMLAVAIAVTIGAFVIHRHRGERAVSVESVSPQSADS